MLSTLPGVYNAHQAGEDAEISVTEDEHAMIELKGLSCHHVRTEEEALNLLFEVCFFILLLLFKPCPVDFD